MQPTEEQKATIEELLIAAVRGMPREQQLEMLEYILCLPWHRKTAITELEMAQTRSALFMHPVSPISAINFLSGFGTGYSVCGSKLTPEIMKHATRKCGWEFITQGPIELIAEGPIKQMQERGYTDAQIINELFQIHIAALRIIDRSIKKKYKESK